MNEFYTTVGRNKVESIELENERKTLMAKKLSPENILDLFDDLYNKSQYGIPFVSKPVSVLAEEYTKRHCNKEEAAKAMLKNQVKKCTTSGIITGFGGAITLPVTIPANIASVLYVQMRMIACAAYMGGYDLSDDQVQTFVYACLAGVSVNEVFKKFGVNFGVKAARAAVDKIPGKVLIAINKKLGFRFITKWGEKGLVNMGKLIPGLGAAINGGFDYIETKAIAFRAYKMFIEGEFDAQSNNIKDADIIEISPEEYEEN